MLDGDLLESFSFSKELLQEYPFDMDVLRDDHPTHARRLAAGLVLSEITSDSAAFLSLEGDLPFVETGHAPSLPILWRILLIHTAR